MLWKVDDEEMPDVEWWGWADSSLARRTPTRSSGPAFIDVLHRLSTCGHGYAEVNRPEEAFPMLALSTASGHAVLHYFPRPEECLVLAGDGSVPSDQAVELPVLDGSAMFSGDVVVTPDSAVSIVGAFARGASAEHRGAWLAL